MNEFIFDPRVFILPPYRQCPACKAAAEYGVLMIGGTSYVRRCRACWHSEPYPLPEIRKKILYLDQMAISNMTKLLHPEVGRGRQIEPFWRDLFELLDVLCKMQLVICPDSQTHREESALAPYAAELKRIYEFFSHGATFSFSHEVLEQQLFGYLDTWLDGHPERPIRPSPEHVIHGQIHGWQERFAITVGGLERPEWTDELRASREQGAEGMTRIHERWRAEQNFDFETVYRQELRGFGTTTIEQHLNALKRQVRMIVGAEPLDYEAFMPTNSNAIVLDIHHQLRAHDVPEEELWQKTAEFFTSPQLDQVPYLRISCLLFAAMARKAAVGGQVRPPNRGTLNDVKTVATVLPYCDAVFVDNEIAGLLAEEPLRTRINYATLVFSPNRRDEFLAYLNTIREEASDEHTAFVREVYGEGYLRPFTGIFAQEADDA